MLIVGMSQLYIEHSCLNLIHPGIDTLIFKIKSAGSSIIVEGSDSLSQLFVIGCHGTGIAQCSQVLAWVETVGASISQGPRVPDAFLDGITADDFYLVLIGEILVYLVLIGDILVFLIQLSSDSLSCRAVDVSASESLCVVFEDQQVVLLTDLLDSFRPG